MGEHIRWRDTPTYRRHAHLMQTDRRYRWSYRCARLVMRIHIYAWAVRHPVLKIKNMREIRKEMREMGM
jgi:hypothetical protein